MIIHGTKIGLIRIAVDQNNDAVSLFETARYNHAIGILKNMILRFRDVLEGQAADQNSHSEHSSVVLQNLLSQNTSTMLDRKGDACDTQEGFLYDQPIEITLIVEMEAYNTASYVVSSILLFNLALALQLKAIESTKASDPRTADRCFASSLSLYRLVMTLNGSSRLLYMIILNNVAEIHKEYNDHERVQKCFHRLLATWVTSEATKGLEALVYNALGWYDTSRLPAATA